MLLTTLEKHDLFISFPVVNMWDSYHPHKEGLPKGNITFAYFSHPFRFILTVVGMRATSEAVRIGRLGAVSHWEMGKWKALL